MTLKKEGFYIVIIAILFITIGCGKDDKSDGSNGKVELFLLETFSRNGNSCQIDESNVITENAPFIRYADFLSYDSSEYTFELSEVALENVKNLQPSVNGAGFAIKADDLLIYTGYFWPTYSSAFCDWVVIDPLMAGISNKIQVRLGYPGLVEGHAIPDRRNDERIIRIFKDDHKLK